MMTESEKALHVLREARRLVARPEGWIQGDYRAPVGGCYCADGALVAACSSGVLDFGVTNDVPAGTRACLHYWNDAPGRTQAEVVALFDRAIALGEDARRYEGLRRHEGVRFCGGEP